MKLPNSTQEKLFPRPYGSSCRPELQFVWGLCGLTLFTKPLTTVLNSCNSDHFDNCRYCQPLAMMTIVIRARPIEKKTQNIKMKCLIFQKSIIWPKPIPTDTMNICQTCSFLPKQTILVMPTKKYFALLMVMNKKRHY